MARSEESKAQKRAYAQRPDVVARKRVTTKAWTERQGGSAVYLRRWTRRRYGLTDADYERMLKEQGGGCGGCGKPPSIIGRQKVLCIDHCHLTNEVRGLLCVRCNTLLGVLEQNPGLIKKLTDYQERFNGRV
jgi:hypothetical protein